MDNKYHDYKKEIEKINKRVKEYIWEQWNKFKAWKMK